METLTTSKTQELFQRRKEVIPNALAIFTQATAVSARNALVTDVDGRELIDFSSGIGVNNIGHCARPVVQAIQEQAEKLLHTCFNVAMYENYIELAETLAELLPHGEKTKVMLTNSGAESVENAVKFARMATGKQGILCFTGAFHGRSMIAMSLTSKTKLKTGCGPFAGELYRIDFPDYFHQGKGLGYDAWLNMEIHRLEEFFHLHAGAQQMAAAIMECVQGEGGFNVVPKPYVQALRRLCDEHRMLLIFDEVQSGFGRTGKWAAYEHFGVTPDLSTWAKALGGGMPIGCLIGRAEVMDAAVPGTIGGTYLGNPVCVAAALATLRLMKEIDICSLGEKTGKVIRERFALMRRHIPEIGDVRGLGAMQAFELVKNGDPWQPDTGLAARLTEACLQSGLIILTAGVHGNVIRVLAPLTIEEDLLNKGLDILEGELLKLTKG